MLVRTGAVWRVKRSTAPLSCISREGSICSDWPSACKNVWGGGIVCPDNPTYLGRGFIMSNCNLFNPGIFQQHRFPWLGPIKNKSRKILVSLQEARHFVWNNLQQGNSTFLIIPELFASFASKIQVANALFYVQKGCNAFLPWAVRRAKGAIRSHSNPFGFTVLDQLFLG